MTERHNFDEALEFYRAGDLQQAEAICRRMIGCNNNSADSLHLLGVVLCRKGCHDEAAQCFKEAIELNPSNFHCCYRLGLLYNSKGCYDDAIEYFQKTIALNPDYAPAYNDLANVFIRKDRIDDAIDNYEKAILLQGDYIDAYVNLGVVLESKGDVDKAVDYFNKASELMPDDAKIHLALGTAYLLSGNFEKGWEGYEWRLKIRMPPFPGPIWDGCLLGGRIIYVYAEQGLGDTIQFARYLPLLLRSGAKRVLFEPQTALAGLFKDNYPEIQVLDHSIHENPYYFDEHVPLLSLPRIFGTSFDNIPFKQKRYLKADPEKVEKYREDIFRIQDSRFNIQALKIGIFWQGDPELERDNSRSISLQYFYPLCRLSGVKVYSLQKGHGIEQLSGLPEDIEIINLGESFKDFSDTAAAIENLDMVITIDTAVAHLSGALGKKTWILLPAFAEWRWLMDISYSPWYEDVRLFRHREPGKKDWVEMMERVTRQVEANE